MVNNNIIVFSSTGNYASYSTYNEISLYPVINSTLPYLINLILIF